MVRQIKILTRAQMCNFFNINVARYSRDRRKKAGVIALMAVWILVIAMICFYVGMLSYGYLQMGLGSVLPMLLTAIAGIIILGFTVIKAGAVIFQRNSYEVLCALPVSGRAIVVSRFLSMYVGNVLLAFTIMIPGMAVQGYFLKPGIGFYLTGVLGSLFIPLMPMAVAVFLGALVTAAASRMKHKSLVASGLTVLMALGIMVLSSSLGLMEEELTPAMLLNLSGMIADMVGRLYPPALWLGRAMFSGDMGQAVLYFGLSVAVFLVMAVIVSANFQKICQSLYSTAAAHNYRLRELKQDSVLNALYKKELKRYFASSIYVTNTIIGPIMMMGFAVMVFLIGEEQIQMYLSFVQDITGLIPFILAVTACLMTTTCTSISMEGREWWIVKSLPVPAKTVYDSKILVNLTLIAPFYVGSEILLILKLRPNGRGLWWLIVLPVIFMIFACVFGIFVNLLLPSFDWENETVVVKQSASALVGGLGGTLVILLCALPVIFLKNVPQDVMKAIIAVMMTGVTVLLYKKIIKTELKDIGAA